MTTNTKPRRTLLVDAAVAACILAARVASADQSTTASAGDAGSGDVLAEVTVTAERRTENLQDVPITIQALSGETLQELHVDTFEDMVKFLPNVSVSGTGPGQSNIYMRGLSTGQTGIQGSGGVGQFPNVAVYLDEQSGQLPDRNLDIYSADIERVEVLEGPQGTLFGAGAQAGVVRYITNKPKLDVEEGAVNAGYSLTTGGDPSTNVDAMINVPVIPGVFAVRAVIYDDARGGYINNIPGTFTREPTDKVVTGYFGGVVPPNSGPLNNNAEVQNAFNPVTYKGGRLEALWQVNDSWNALVTEAVQNMDAEGVDWEEAYDGEGKTLPDLSVQLYNPSYDKDMFEDTQLTINGRIAALKVVYSGGFLVRRVNESQDYTNYSRGTYAGYYQCNYPGYPFVGGKPTAGSTGYCYSPSGFWTDHQSSTHQSHELRVSTPDDWRLRGLVGLFYENFTVHEQTDWFYGTSPNFVQIVPPAGSNSNNPDVRPLGDSFFDDITRGYKQKAAFTSIDFDIVPKKLTLTLGTRWYNIEDFEGGSNVGSFGCEIYGPYDGGVPAYPCGTQDGSNGNNLTAQSLDKTYAGFKSRANLTWHVTDDAMLYYTWSQGFRPGGFNRGATVLRPDSPLYGVWQPAVAFGPDTLINNEIGWKTEWFDHRLQFNGAVYQELWQNVQLGIFDPSVTGNLTFDTNGPNFRVIGSEFSAIVVPTRGLTVTASGSWNSSESTSTLNLKENNGSPIPALANPFGPIGTPLAQSPPFQGNIRTRYEFPLADYQAFGQVGVNHVGGSYSTTNFLQTTLQGAPQRFYDPAYTTWDIAVGIGRNSWKAQLYGENMNNQRGLNYSTYTQYVKSDFIIRPQTYGLRFSYAFGGK
jgi:iron complex outermembrane receptor protein